MMDIIGVKVLAGFIFFSLAFVFGLLPFWFLKSCSQPGKDGTHNGKKLPIVKLLHSLASGVLLATCLLHLLPESMEAVRGAMANCAFSLAASQEVDVSSTVNSSEVRDETNFATAEKCVFTNSGIFGAFESYPVAELLMALGFLFIYVVDSTIQSFKMLQQERYDDSRSRDEIRYSRLSDSDETAGFGMEKADVQSADLYKQRKPRPRRYVSDEQSVRRLQNGFHSDSDRNEANSDNEMAFSEEIHPLTDPKNYNGQEQAEAKPAGQLRSIALVAALCIHGFFDGVMLGLQTSKSVLLSLLLALSLHKSFVATGLSLTLFNNYDSSTKLISVVLQVLAFSSVAPLGLIGSSAFVHSTVDFSGVEGEGEDQAGLVPGCLQAFAVGTFMYVTFSELSGKHDHGPGSLRYQLLSHVFLMVGFVFMAYMRALLGDT